MSENNVNQEAKDQPFEATTYGGLLRIARENKELSIDQVSSQLRISPDQIEGLESDNYKVFPTPVYARAHLRSYARLLGIDEAKIISLFNAALAPDDKDPRTFIRRTTQELAPYHDAQPKNFVGKFIAGLLFLAVVIAFKKPKKLPKLLRQKPPRALKHLLRLLSLPRLLKPFQFWFLMQRLNRLLSPQLLRRLLPQQKLRHRLIGMPL